MVKEREGGGMGWNQTSQVPLGGPGMSLPLERLPWSQVQPAYSLKLVRVGFLEGNLEARTKNKLPGLKIN